MKRILILLIGISIIVISCNPKNEVKISVSSLKSDLDTLVSILEEVHINPYYKLPKQSFYKKIDSLKEQLHNPLTEIEFYKLVTPIVSELQDGHTFVSFPKIVGKWIFPFEVKTRNAAPFITISESDGQIPVNSEIISVNGTDSKSIIENLIRYESGEDVIFRVKWIGNSFNDYMNFFYNIDSLCDIEYKHNGQIHKSQISLSKNANIILANKGKVIAPYSLQIRPEISTAIIDFRTFSDVNHVDSIFAIIKKEKLKNLIIDIRENGGGDSDVGDEFLQYLAPSSFQQYNIEKTVIKVSKQVKRKYNRELESLKQSGTLSIRDSLEIEKIQNFLSLPTGSLTQCPYASNLIPLKNTPNKFYGKVYVLTSEKTYSSASDFAQTIKAYGIGEIIGEQTGGWIVCYGDIVFDELPNSKLRIGISTVKFVNIGTNDTDWHGVIPDRKINADSSMEFVLKEISKNYH
jgi:hypothetical protein